MIVMKGEKITVLQEKGQRTHFALGGQGRPLGIEGGQEGREKERPGGSQAEKDLRPERA